MDDRTTQTIPQEFHKAGYDREEEWFALRNQQLIQELRSRLNALQREREQLERQIAHETRAVRSGPEPKPLLRKVKDFLAGIVRPRPSGIGQFPV